MSWNLYNSENLTTESTVDVHSSKNLLLILILNGDLNNYVLSHRSDRVVFSFGEEIIRKVKPYMTGPIVALNIMSCEENIKGGNRFRYISELRSEGRSEI